MLPILLIPILAAPLKPSADVNRTFLMRIDSAVSHMSDKKTSFVRFERAVTKADAVRCRQVFSKVAPNSNYYADCAFVQAWYGIDYDANIQRLLRPYRIWHTNPDRWSKAYPQHDGDSTTLTDLDGIYTVLNWLYLKHHDVKSLGTWEDLRLDGAWGEGSSGELGELWGNHATDMLSAAYGHPQRIKNLADSLTFANAQTDDAGAVKRTLASVRPYTRSKNSRVAFAALALTGELKSGRYQ